MVRRLLNILALSLVLGPVTASFAASTMVLRRATAVATSANPAFENASSTASGVNVISATCTLTTTANTTKVLVCGMHRRGAGQDITGCTFNGVAMTDTGATSPSGSMRTTVFYLNNPGAVTSGNLVCTWSALANLGLAGASFTGATVLTSTGSSVGSVATSSATATTTSGNLLVQFLCKQDPASSDPTLNTAGATQRFNFGFSSSSNGGYYKSATLTATGASTTINYSWTTATNTAHSWLVLAP